jgi:hypothetical protein
MDDSGPKRSATRMSVRLRSSGPSAEPDRSSPSGVMGAASPFGDVPGYAWRLAAPGSGLETVPRPGKEWPGEDLPEQGATRATDRQTMRQAVAGAIKGGHVAPPPDPGARTGHRRAACPPVGVGDQGDTPVPHSLRRDPGRQLAATGLERSTAPGQRDARKATAPAGHQRKDPAEMVPPYRMRISVDLPAPVVARQTKRLCCLHLQRDLCRTSMKPKLSVTPGRARIGDPELKGPRSMPTWRSAFLAGRPAGRQFAAGLVHQSRGPHPATDVEKVRVLVEGGAEVPWNTMARVNMPKATPVTGPAPPPDRQHSFDDDADDGVEDHPASGRRACGVRQHRVGDVAQPRRRCRRLEQRELHPVGRETRVARALQINADGPWPAGLFQASLSDVLAPGFFDLDRLPPTPPTVSFRRNGQAGCRG